MRALFIVILLAVSTNAIALPTNPTISNDSWASWFGRLFPTPSPIIANDSINWAKLWGHFFATPCPIIANE